MLAQSAFLVITQNLKISWKRENLIKGSCFIYQKGDIKLFDVCLGFRSQLQGIEDDCPGNEEIQLPCKSSHARDNGISRLQGN